MGLVYSGQLFGMRVNGQRSVRITRKVRTKYIKRRLSEGGWLNKWVNIRGIKWGCYEWIYEPSVTSSAKKSG